MQRRLAFVVMLALGLALAACSSGGSPAAKPASPTPSAADATAAAAPSNTVWLCKPGLANNPCAGDLTATLVNGDGTTSVESASSAKAPPIDCFYVYPTASTQPTANANLDIDPEEINVARLQAARFSQVCSVYAPMYRQLTVNGLFNMGLPEGSAPADPQAPYDDIAAAWQDYLAHDNHGRGVVLIGHSQGSFILTRLIHDQIDNNDAVRGRLVSAIILGGNVTVANDAAPTPGETPAGGGTGSFAHIPPCAAPGQLGCVVAYSSFGHPPPAGSLFGRVGGAGAASTHVLCTNPAALGGGTGKLRPYFPTMPSGITGFNPQPAVPTPWIGYPDLFEAHCESQDGASWLQIDDVRKPGDPRPKPTEPLGPGWGYHLLDINIALGNLVDIVQHQAEAWKAAHPGG